MSGKRKYATWCGFVLCVYTALLWFGVSMFGRPNRHYVPGGLRGAANTGYRSFWYSGFQGGK